MKIYEHDHLLSANVHHDASRQSLGNHMRSSSFTCPRHPHFKSCKKKWEHAVQAASLLCRGHGFQRKVSCLEFGFCKFTGGKQRFPSCHPFPNVENLQRVTHGARGPKRRSMNASWRWTLTNLSAVCLAAFVQRSSAAGFDSKRMAMSP